MGTEELVLVMAIGSGDSPIEEPLVIPLDNCDVEKFRECDVWILVQA